MMYPLKQLKRRPISSYRRIKYVTLNPGLTASQYGRLLGEPYGTSSAALYKLVGKGILKRCEAKGALGQKIAWRYYNSKYDLCPE